MKYRLQCTYILVFQESCKQCRAVGVVTMCGNVIANSKGAIILKLYLRMKEIRSVCSGKEAQPSRGDDSSTFGIQIWKMERLCTFGETSRTFLNIAIV